MTATSTRALVVDDEPLARRRLTKLLAKHDAIQVVGEAENGEAACALVESLRPDVVFLDIQMPGLSGFDVLTRLRVRPRPRIIFVTAHDAFAVRAFEEQALDYLLKPVEPERLARTVRRLTESAGQSDSDPSDDAGASQLAGVAARAIATAGESLDARLDRLLAAIAQPRSLTRRIPVRLGARIVLVDVLSAVFFRAEDKYTVLYTADAEHVIDRTIDELEQTLDPESFLRIHRAAIVNVQFVRDLTAVEGGRFLVALTDPRGSKLYASRRGARTLRDRLGL